MISKKQIELADEYTERASRMARDLAEITQNAAIQMLKSQPDSKDISEESGDMLQGQIYHALAAFFLSTSIKILEKNKLPQHFIDMLCHSTIKMALEMAAKSELKTVKEH